MGLTAFTSSFISNNIFLSSSNSFQNQAFVSSLNNICLDFITRLIVFVFISFLLNSKDATSFELQYNPSIHLGKDWFNSFYA